VNTRSKLIIIDRDGVINYDQDTFIKSPDEWIPIPGSIEAISALKTAGWLIAVATNQSGLARGLFDLAMLQTIHDKMNRALMQNDATIDLLVWCPHGPHEDCNCRKPKPGLYKQIAAHFQCSLIDVPVIGDSKRDLDAAAAVGAKPILVATGKGNATLASGNLPTGTTVYADLEAAVHALIMDNHPYGYKES
jgi:D-glycero-D-manno-heptose 1,7-bisphosphate phosphatase